MYYTITANNEDIFNILGFVSYVLYSLKKSSSKSENSLCDTIREGFEKIQARSAERVRKKLTEINRFVILTQQATSKTGTTSCHPPLS